MDEWPFDTWLKYAVKVLHLTPSEFWSLSICDWLTLSVEQNGGVMKRTQLENLMQIFPDKDEHD